MADLVKPVGGPTGIQQLITAGNQFDGTLPGTAVAYANGMNKWATATKGGLFYFENASPVIVTDYLADFGTSIPYTITLVNLDGLGVEIPGESILLEENTAQHVYVTTRILLGPGQAMKLVTTGATNAMVCRVWATAAGSFRG